MKTFYKKTCRIRFQIKENDKATGHGGVVLVDALARRFGLFKKVRAIPGLDPRTRKGAGFAPEALVAQIVYATCCGAMSLSDVERLGQDPVWLGLVGLKQGADESTLGEWLRAQTKESLAALQRLNCDFVKWALPQIKPGRILNAGVLDVFFNDTQIEACGKKIEGAKINYNGDLALSLQTIWTGPLVLDAELGSAGDVRDLLPEFLEERQEVWAKYSTHFYADSASSAAGFLKKIEDEGRFTGWSVSYNKWTSKLDRLAEEMRAGAWSKPEADDPEHTQYAWLKHQPGEADRNYTFATRKQKQSDELLARYSYVVGRSREATPQRFMEHHQLKGACERGFSDLLSGLDLHHPPCLKLIANQVFYALVILAHNLVQTFKLLDLDDAYQGWCVRSIILNLINVPVSVSTHANYRKATMNVPKTCLSWFRRFINQWFPKQPPGRPKEDSEALPSVETRNPCGWGLP